MDPTLIRPWDLRQHVYCERIPYFVHACVLPQRETWNMQEGAARHDLDEVALVSRGTLDGLGLVGWFRVAAMELEAPVIGLRGVVDVVFTDGVSFVPVEYKSAATAVARGHRLQLGAYALMLEEVMGGAVSRALWVGRDRRAATVVDVDARLRGDVRRTLARVREAWDRADLPPPARSVRQCAACEFRNFCGDV